MSLRKKITEITKGKTGTGLLIENDGYISLDIPQNKVIYEGIGNDNNELPEKLIFDAVFQKYDTPNANGRIYPEAILKREVDKYQEAIRERRAYGECYTPDAMVLTEEGWKKIEEVKEGEVVLTLNTETKEIEKQPVIRKIERKHTGKMIRIKGRGIDDLVTPEHGYPIFGRDHKFKGFYTAEDIMNKKVPDQNHCYIPKQGLWKGDNEKEFFILPALTEDRISKIHDKRLKEKYSQELIIPMDIWVKFMGLYLSEGSCSPTGNGYVVTIHQKKEDVCEAIECMLETWGIDYKKRLRKSDNKTTFNITDIRLYDYLKPLGICYDKYIPIELKNLNQQHLQTFYNWFLLGDGRIRGNKRLGKKGSFSDDVFSSSSKLTLDLNEVQLKIGYSGTFHSEKRDNDRYIGERLIKGENCHEMYFSYRSLVKGIYLDQRFIEITEEDYDGDVMCIEVPNHTWYVMQNGKCHWTKNCNHPESSSIDLSRIALNIIELHWEGKTLVGKIEIPITRGFRKFGIVSTRFDELAHLILSGLKIGVSSRGLGSVENKNGYLVVGNDYEIICWDAVTSPSTPSAWICTKDGEIELYKESEIKKNSPLIKEEKNDKFNKFQKWLLE